jgi:hypothetical protein
MAAERRVEIVTSEESLRRLEARASDGMHRLFQADPRIADFHQGRRIAEVYQRHLLEDVIRIRMNNTVDSHALASMIETDSVASVLLAYLHEEYGHDQLLAADLIAMGMSEAEIENATPLFSTELLMAYIRFSIDREGPLVAFVWDWLVEWYSGQFNQDITEAAASELGEAAVEQTRRHLEIDNALEHENRIAGALGQLVVRDDSLRLAEQYVDRFIKLIEIYFMELFDSESKL